MNYPRPTGAELLAAAGKTVPDVIAANLKILFCGINPGLYTAAVGHHFARPGNRFWPALFAAGFTSRLLSPYDEHELLEDSYGITNLVNRASATADALSPAELQAGKQHLEEKVLHFRPQTLAILGIGAYRSAFGRPKANLGRQPETIGTTIIWILPNPSGLNAHYQLDDFARLLRELQQNIG
ncbi:MAG: G/U mismatch-specific DNA glycosylase [Chloroflexi bacterium]|nr:G/U mismatch-specific DNA glycosylase [Chloroflexota bacterium]